MDVVRGVDSGGDFVIAGEPIHVPDHVRGWRDSGEVVSGNNTVPVDREKRTGARPVGYLSDSDGGDRAHSHGIGSVFTSNMIHPSEGEVTVATRVRGAIVYQLESTELVRPSGGWEEIETEGNKWDKVLEDCPGASVGEYSVDAPYALLDVAYGTLTTLTCMPGPAVVSWMPEPASSVCRAMIPPSLSE